MFFLEIPNENIISMTVKELKIFAHENNIHIQSNFNKEEIIKTILRYKNTLTKLKNYFESKYDISIINNDNSTGLNFYLNTSYYNVPIKIRQDYNYPWNIMLSISFKESRRQRHGNLTGYCFYVIKDRDIDYLRIDNEFNSILNNIKEDGTWCDESYYDD